MRTRLAENVVAGVLTVLMLLWLWQATRLPYTESGRPGPGFFPVWLSAIGLVLGIAVLVAGLRVPGREAASPQPDDPHPDDSGTPRSETQWAGTLRLTGALLGAIAFLVLVPILGFVVGLALYLAYLCLVIARMRVATALVLSLSTAAFIYLVFVELLGVPFPPGLMGT